MPLFLKTLAQKVRTPRSKSIFCQQILHEGGDGILKVSERVQQPLQAEDDPTAGGAPVSGQRCEQVP